MNKKFTKLMAALALLVFMTPSLAGWGQTRTATTLFEETFANCTGTMGWSGNAANGTFVADNEGWNTANAYGAGGSAKFGKSSGLGSAQTPSISFTGDATLTFKAGAWNSSSESTNLKLSATGGTLKQNGQNITSVTLTKGSWTTYTIDITGVTTSVRIKFEGNSSSSSRFFLDDVVVTQEVSTEPSITVGSNPPESITVDYGQHSSYQGGDLTPLAVTYDNITISGASDFAVQFYDGNGENPNELDEGDDGYPDWISSATVYKEGSNNYKLGLWIEQNDDDERYAYLKVYAAGDEDYVYSDFVTITQTARPAPSISVNPSSLTGFTYQHNAGPSAAQSFAASGSNLTANVSVSVPADGNFEICATQDGTYGNSLTLTPSSGTLASTNVYVRLKAGKAIAENYTGAVTLNSTGATNQTVSLSGSVTGYNVTYNGNGSTGGTVPTDATAYTYNHSVTVLGNTGDLAKTGHTFAGWNTQADGTGTDYAANATFNITANTTLYAKWTVNTHNITLPTADTYGEYTMDKTNPVAYGTEVTLTYIPASSYEAYVATWSVNDSPISGNKFNMPDEDVTVTVTLTEHAAEFTNGVYSETMTNQNSFNNMEVVSTVGDGTWSFDSQYSCASIQSSYDETDWLITPKMQVQNGKLNICFDIWHQGTLGQLSLKWSASNDVVNGTWENLEFSEGTASSWHSINDIVIETQSQYVYVAFVYDNTSDDHTYKYQIKNFIARQYYKVTFNANLANGVTGTMEDLLCLTNTATALTANAFSATGKAFNGWNTQADGSGTNYADGANITITQNTTLYAQWADAYTVTFTTNGHADGTKTVISGDAIGTLPTPTADFIPTGYDFTGWYNGNLDVNGSSDAPVYIASDYEPTADVTLRAVFAQVITPAGPETWTKITDLSTVTAGVYALITENDYAFNGELSDKYIGQSTSQAFSFTNNVALSAPSGTLELTLVEVKDANDVVLGYTMYNSNKGYLYAAGASKENLKWHESEDSYWSYTSSAWRYSKYYSTSNHYGYLRTYSDDNTFRVYGTKSNQELYMAKKTPGTPAGYGYYYTFSGTIITITENTTRTADIPMNEFVTVTNGATFTFSGSNLGTAENLIIEDGCQLYTDGVIEATIKKNITAYNPTLVGQGISNGWHFISYPLNTNGTDGDDPNDVTNMIASTAANYDLYKLNGNTWENYKAHADFTLSNGHGYLYANANGVNLEFAGSLNFRDPDNDFVSLDNPGWNLVGNPFAYNTYPSMSYYKMNADGTGIDATECTTAVAVPPCTGILVNNSGAGLITFSKNQPQPAGGAFNGNLQMTLSQQATNRGTAATIDNAIVSFNEGSQLGKFYFGEQNANLYIPQGTEEYAIVSSEAQGTMPVNFRANENGEYTLTVNPENVEMNYLHLIDNMTGADVDLLANPSYSFNAKVTDYESRFKLVFASANQNGEEGNDNFAFFSNGQYIIANEGEATLQVIDIMGRILSSETINGSVSKNINAPTGVYMLRLINGENVKVQKMVVR